MAALTTFALLTPSNSVQAMVANSAGRPSQIADLTTGLANGSEAAFTKFHETYFDRLFRYHLVIARGDETFARDALQETLLRVIRHARVFEEEQAFWCWLTVLARSAARDGGRKRRRYWQMLANYAKSIFLPEPNAEPEDIDEQLQPLLIESLGELPGEMRGIIEGKYLRGETVRELANQLGLTEKAVESRLLRGRRELRNAVLRRLQHET